MSLSGFKVLYHVGRASEIVRILAKWGFDEFLKKLDIPRVLRRNLENSEARGLNQWQRFRKVCEDLGPVFVKLGQVLSSLPGRLPRGLTEELKLLRDQVEPVDSAQMRRELEQELGRPIEEVFSEFDWDHVRAGSLGQIYKARLRDSGEWVAVKIQRPGIDKRMKEDLEIVAFLVKQAHENIEVVQPYNLPSIFREARRAMLNEVDFHNEARNAEIFNRQNPDPEHIFAPKVFGEWTTRSLLVTQWVVGDPPAKAALSHEDSKRLAELGGASVFHQVIVTGFFHSDPHGGNVLITRDKRICLLDWGQVGIITPEMRYTLADLFTAISQNQPDKVVEVAHRMARGGRRAEYARLGKEVAFILTQAHADNRVNQEIGVVGMELIQVFGRMGLNLPADYAMMAKAVICVEEVGRSLDPDFDIKGIAQPYIDKLLWERWNPFALAKRSLSAGYETLLNLQRLPGLMERLMHRFEDNDLSVRLDFDKLDELEDTIA
ncbi:MAG: ABC1 kinase family protein, partial [Verrucomicrobiota bacterium]